MFGLSCMGCNIHIPEKKTLPMAVFIQDLVQNIATHIEKFIEKSGDRRSTNTLVDNI